MKRYIYLIIGIYFCVLSCKKEVSLPDENTSMLIGTTTNMNIHQINDTIIGGYNQPQSIDLDVNGDNIPDFRLTSELWGSPAVGMHPRSSIMCLNSNCMIYGMQKNDTSYLHINISTNSSQSQYIYATTYYYTCSRYNANDSIVQVLANQAKIITKDKGDSFNYNNLFNSNSFTIYNESFSLPSTQTTINDTTFVVKYYYDYTCDNLPSDKIIYLEIKIKDSARERLGWLKISISNGFKITIFESAIQK